MNNKINVKSALIGLIAGILVTFGVGASSSSGNQGRYQFAATEQPGGGSECFIIDTTTGKVWKAHVGPNIGNDAGFFQAKNEDK